MMACPPSAGPLYELSEKQRAQDVICQIADHAFDSNTYAYLAWLANTTAEEVARLLFKDAEKALREERE